MKYTFNLDKELLENAVRAGGFKTKTAAVTYGLEEIVRRDELTALLKKGLGLSPEELETMYVTPEEVAQQVAEASDVYPNPS
jgi:hypothetical protein